MIKKLLSKIGEVGFRMDEVMSGLHSFEPVYGDPRERRPIEFRATWGPDNIGEWINPFSNGFLRQDLVGTITVDGLCKDAKCVGTLELNYFDGQFLRYDFNFSADGKLYRYVGEKVNIKPWNLPVSHTTCYGVITEEYNGTLVSKSTTHFRAKTIPAFLKSFRVI